MTGQSLRYNDLVSPTMSVDEYLEQKAKYIRENYENYEPKPEIIENIKKFLTEKNQNLKIVALGADWCPDCSRNVPRMIKVVHSITNGNVEMRILYGVMVNALHRPGETIWHESRSPPEATDPRFDLEAIPSFYFFNAKDEFLGVIIEGPKWTSSLEKDILEILKKNL